MFTESVGKMFPGHLLGANTGNVVGSEMADPDPRPQLDKFKDLARELECDDDEAAFDERLKKLAVAKPKPKAVDDRKD